MPNYTDAPWNAPVEDEGKELSDSDIPTRRRKPGEKKEDVLTELIFGTYSVPKKIVQPPQPEQRPVFTAKVVAPRKVAAAKKELGRVKKESALDKRARLLKELAELEKKEKEIASSLRTFVSPEKKNLSYKAAQKKVLTAAPLLSSKKGGRKRVTSSSFKNAKPSVSSPFAKVDALQKEPKKSITAALPVSIPVRTPEKKIQSVPPAMPAPTRMDAIVHLDNTKESIKPKKEVVQSPSKFAEKTPISATEPVIPVVSQPVPVTASLKSEETEQKIFDYYTKDHEHPKKRRLTRQVLVIASAFAVVVVAVGLIDGKRLPTSFAFLSNISGFLRQESFAVTHENRESFPQLVALYGAAQEAQSQFSGSKELDELIDSLETFFSANESFVWKDYFNGKGNELRDVSQLGNVLKQKKLFEAAHEHVLLMDSNSLTETLTWYSFVGEFFKDDATYLVLTADTAHPTPAGGEPMYYSVLEVSQGRANIVKTGLAADLNAALSTKVIPPRAVQGIKTDLDLMEAGWFFTFPDAAQLMTLMYEQTTQEKIDGVILVTDSSAKILMESSGVGGELSQTWLQEVLTHIGSGASFESLATQLKEEFNRGAVQVSFEQNTFASFARGKLNRVAETETMDSLAASLRVWEGNGAEISLLEYKPMFYGDGSVVGNALVTLKNLGNEHVRAYLKLYVPKQSMILDAQGYSQKIAPASFDYSANGFAQHALITGLNERGSEEFVVLDEYDEGDFLVVGGWVLLPANGERVASLSYRIPTRLDWRARSARYDFTVVPMSAHRDVPFRFAAQLEEGVTYEWKEPLGYVAQQTAEFQKALSSHVKLSSSVGFSEPDTSGASQ